MKFKLASLFDAIGKVYLRWTDPKRKLRKLKRKLEANREQQKKLFNSPSTSSTRKRFSKLLTVALRLRREIERLQG